MQCPRCSGMMVYEQIFTSQGGLDISRCVHCGDVVDSVVISNREHPTYYIKKVFRGCNTVARISG
ncbi:MAG: hypothetical protein VST69_02910 [Nitrospirota bacterium]|nr:hypothetical protein [Nitrospirota bacterium]